MQRFLALAGAMVLIFAMWVPVASADKKPAIKLVRVLKAGRYEAKLIKRQPGRGQTIRRNLYERFKFIEETTRIPAIKGYRFGMRFIIVGEPAYQEIELRVFRHHPPVKKPGSKHASTLATYTKKAQLNYATVVGYGFDHDWELVPGEHRFQVYLGPKKLIEQVFTVYRP